MFINKKVQKLNIRKILIKIERRVHLQISRLLCFTLEGNKFKYLDLFSRQKTMIEYSANIKHSFEVNKD